MTQDRIKWVDGAKGIAMLMIILVHVAGQMQGVPAIVSFIFAFGSMGVQLFFILSAYTACLTNIAPGGLRFAPIAYYLKRFVRLAPLYWFGIILYFTMARSGIAYAGPVSNYTIWNVLPNILLINNLFPAAQNYIVPGGWCIGCFALFYLLFPALNSFLKSNAIIKTICVIILSAIISFLLLNLTKLSGQYVYWLIVNQIGVFLIGMLYYKHSKFQRTGLIGIQFLSGCAIVGFTAILIRILGNQYVYQHILVSISFIFLLNVLRRYEDLIPRWLVTFGKLSYPIYILHFAVSCITITFIGKFISDIPGEIKILIITLITAFISFIFAKALDYTLDSPCRRYLNRIINKIPVNQEVN